MGIKSLSRQEILKQYNYSEMCIRDRYPTDHRTLVDLAREEQEQDARPAIVGKIEAPEEYDTIFRCV